MILREFPFKRWAPLLAALCVVTLGIGLRVGSAFGEEGGPDPASSSASALWQAAEKAAAAGHRQEAAALLGRLVFRYPEAKQTGEALWQEAQLRRELALGRKNADWGKVRSLYHQYVTEYPKGRHFEKAYLELGLAHYRMHYFPEAVTYLQLFLDRFPHSRFRDKALYWQGRALVENDRPEAAKRIFQKLATGKDRRYRIKGEAGLGDIYLVDGRFQDALATFQGALRDSDPESKEHFEIIRDLGLTQARLRNEVACRDDLYRYLNVVPDSPHEAEILFELGESYWRTGDTEAARALYKRALAKASPGGRVAILSRFRLALAKSRREKSLALPGQKPKDFGPAGDEPYQAVLDNFGQEPGAQDARYALLQRFRARGESEQVLSLAKAYLNAPGGNVRHRQEVTSLLVQLLTSRVEKLLQGKKYRQVCDLYQDDAHYLPDQDGKLLYLLGQGFEALGLNNQAAVIYYRALAGKLSPAEKIDLYRRRARVYLAKGDLASAERLLSYLRDIYKGQKVIGEFLDLSGRLREAQGKTAEAASFYTEACGDAEAGTPAPSCHSEVRLRLQSHQWQAVSAALARCRHKGLLAPEDLQQDYSKLGDGWSASGQLQQAAEAYVAAVGKTMPQDGQLAQAVHLRLADLDLKLGRSKEGVAQYQKASSGPDPLLAKSAKEALQLSGIEQAAAALSSFAPSNRRAP